MLSMNVWLFITSSEVVLASARLRARQCETDQSSYMLPGSLMAMSLYVNSWLLTGPVAR